MESYSGAYATQWWLTGTFTKKILLQVSSRSNALLYRSCAYRLLMSCLSTQFKSEYTFNVLQRIILTESREIMSCTTCMRENSQNVRLPEAPLGIVNQFLRTNIVNDDPEDYDKLPSKQVTHEILILLFKFMFTYSISISK